MAAFSATRKKPISRLDSMTLRSWRDLEGQTLAEVCHPEAAGGAEPKAETPEDAEGSQDATTAAEPQWDSTQLGKFEILRRPAAFRCFAAPAFGSLRMTIR